MPHATQPQMQVLRFEISGMSCAGCAGRVKRTMETIEGAEDVSVSLAAETAQLRLADASRAADVSRALTDAGYPATLSTPTVNPIDRSQRKAEEAARLRRDTFIALALSLPVFILEMGGHLIPG